MAADRIPEVLAAPLLRLGHDLSAVHGMVDAPVGERIAAMIAEVDDLLVETRRLFCETRGVSPEPTGLASCLQVLVEYAATRLGDECRFDFAGDPSRVPPAIAGHVCVLAQEAVLDVVARDGAAQLAVDLVVGPDHVEVSVTDGPARRTVMVYRSPLPAEPVT